MGKIDVGSIRYKKYTSDALHTALVCIRNKCLSVAKASKLFGIPPRTLYQRLKILEKGKGGVYELILTPEVILKVVGVGGNAEVVGVGGNAGGSPSCDTTEMLRQNFLFHLAFSSTFKRS